MLSIKEGMVSLVRCYPNLRLDIILKITYNCIGGRRTSPNVKTVKQYKNPTKYHTILIHKYDIPVMIKITIILESANLFLREWALIN